MTDIHHMDHEAYFKRNRYSKEYILNEFGNIETWDKAFELNIEPDYSIEVYIKQPVSEDYIKEVLAEIPELDNCILELCEMSAKKSDWHPKVFCLVPGWVEIEQNKVIMEYYGEYVNTSTSFTFVKTDIGWKRE